MKNYLILLTLGVLLVACATPKREITRQIEDQKFKEAQAKLDSLFKQESGEENPELWLLQADLYMHYFDYAFQVPEQEGVIDPQVDDPDVLLAEPEAPPEPDLKIDNPLIKAYEAINKAEELDDANIHLLEIQQKRLILSEQVFTHGLIHYEDEEFAEASEKFYTSFAISRDLEAKDTMTLFNAAIAAELGQATQDARKYYSELVELEHDDPYIYAGLSNTYNLERDELLFDIEKYDAYIKAYKKSEKVDSLFEESETESDLIQLLARELDTYTDIAEHIIKDEPHKFDREEFEKTQSKYDELVSKRDELEDKSLKYIKKGREKYPEDIDLIFNEANFYLLTGRTEEARDILEHAIEQDPDNAALQFAFGANYEQMAEDERLSEEERQMAFENAIEAYETAIELDDQYIDAYYNLGALYFNEGIRILEQADAELRETQDFDQFRKAEEEIEEMWLKSQPYMEEAMELIEPGHEMYQAVVTSLYHLYVRTDQDEKQQELEEDNPEIFKQR